jgi:hypothetical protein
MPRRPLCSSSISDLFSARRWPRQKPNPLHCILRKKKSWGAHKTQKSIQNYSQDTPGVQLLFPGLHEEFPPRRPSKHRSLLRLAIKALLSKSVHTQYLTSWIEVHDCAHLGVQRISILTQLTRIPTTRWYRTSRTILCSSQRYVSSTKRACSQPTHLCVGEP